MTKDEYKEKNLKEEVRRLQEYLNVLGKRQDNIDWLGLFSGALNMSKVDVNLLSESTDKEGFVKKLLNRHQA